jgi:putative membrane protein
MCRSGGQSDTEAINMSADEEQEASALSLGNRLALERTRIAYERTMMAWVRTAASMITFGFSVYKFFGLEPGQSEALLPTIGPREFGIGLISIGIITLVTGRLEHRRDLRQLAKYYPEMPLSGTRLVEAVVAIFGAVTLIAVILRA